MTPEEVNRAIESKNRVKKLEAKEKASFDYILANLIGKNVSLVLGGKGSIPPIEEVYSGLFGDEKEEQAQAIQDKKTQLSILRFRQFAEAHNKNLKNKGG